MSNAKPVRLQRSRKKGARTPDGAKYCGRPTVFGNPFSVARFGQARSVKLHRAWVTGQLSVLALERLGYCPAEIEALERWRQRLLPRLGELTGHDLQCWCALTHRWCHVETLLDLANMGAAA